MSKLRFHNGWLLGFGIFFCTSPLYADTSLVLKPFTASFSVKRNVIPLGKLELKFSLNGTGDYVYHAHTMPGMLAGWFSADEVIEESRGRLSNNSIHPSHYTYQGEDGEKENTALSFDWNSAEVETTSHGVTWSQSITPGTQDKLSQQLLVRLDLAQEREEMTYQVADGGKIKSYHFRVDGEEQIKTPYGQLRCLRVMRSKASRKPDYTIWFAPELDYLPVKIERRQSGRTYRMVLDELKMENN
ncbi:MAG: DUF3108 domain-containing protein [Candidatus Thiodiazotropha sp.]|nr:DUF3108 domain-containing protein [Candidatus Thiodiazotropha sp.]MCM8883506.1 DUF3108 domain-containing protein [Candidatus Thiodiazotropha sp.]